MNFLVDLMRMFFLKKIIIVIIWFDEFNREFKLAEESELKNNSSITKSNYTNTLIVGLFILRSRKFNFTK